MEYRYYHFKFNAETYDATSPTRTRKVPFALECYAASLEEAEEKVAKQLRISVETLHTKSREVSVYTQATTFLH